MPPIEIQLDAMAFMPKTENGLTYAFSNVPVSIAGNRQIAMVHRNCSTVDCGFSVKVPEGYKLILDLADELKDHGLEVYKNVITGENRATLSLRNLGREIAVVNHRDRVATMRIEPIYPLTFKVLEDENVL